MDVLKSVIKVIAGCIFLFFVIIVTPGLPPHVEFETINVAPPLELIGKLAPNTVLDNAQPIKLDSEIKGPESIAIKGDYLYTGVVGGDIIRINKNGEVTFIAKFGQECEGEWEMMKCGRVAGLRFDSTGILYAADIVFGIFKVDVDTGTYENIVPMNVPIDGKFMKFPDDLDIGQDGSIYFSDASTNADPSSMLMELLGPPSGRLIKYDVKTKTCSVLIDKLHFSNGVQLSKNEDFVMVAEMVRSRVWRYFLTGARKGQSEIFVDKLPGLPDNIRSNGKDGYFIVLASPIRSAKSPGLVDTLGVLPLVRKFIARTVSLCMSLLDFMETVYPSTHIRQLKFYVSHLGPIGQLNKQPNDVIVVEIDNNGNIIESHHNKNGPISHSSEMHVGHEFVYFGSPSARHIYKMKISDLKR